MKTIINKSSIPALTLPGVKKQQGLTMISWIVVIVFLLFQAVIAMNVIPVYINDSTIKSIMQELPNDVKAKDSSVNELKQLVAKRMKINSVYAVKLENIKVKKGRAVKIVTVEYEPRGTLIGNLDYIVSFKHEARIQTR